MISKTLKGFRELYRLFTEMWWLWAAIALFTLLVGGVTYLLAVSALGLK